MEFFEALIGCALKSFDLAKSAQTQNSKELNNDFKITDDIQIMETSLANSKAPSSRSVMASFNKTDSKDNVTQNNDFKTENKGLTRKNTNLMLKGSQPMCH